MLQGIWPKDSGLAVVQNFPKSKIVKKVHSFVDLASYFWKFIEKFDIIAKPLYQLKENFQNYFYLWRDRKKGVPSIKAQTDQSAASDYL